MTRDSQVVAIIQARMGASRLPGKVLLPLGGTTALNRVIRCAQTVPTISKVVVATTIEAEDDTIETACSAAGVSCFRGSSEDVLDRFYRAAKQESASTVVRLTADCPLLDPAVVELVVQRTMEAEADYGTNTLPPTYPDGLDVEVMSFEALSISHRLAKRALEREHVTQFIRIHPEIFKSLNVQNPLGDYSHHRWTLDEPRDYQFLLAVCERLEEPSGYECILSLLAQDPALMEANKTIERNEGLAKSLAAEKKSGTGQALYRKAKRVIPGGTQLLSKRPEMFLPDQWPAYYRKAKGAQIWDLDDNRYLDFSINSVGACLLGYADDEVGEKVKEAIDGGSISTLNCPEEVELAELLLQLHPWAEMCRFARGGGEAMGIAVRTARALTGRDMVAFCGYHGWHDWYLAANLGAEKSLDGHLLPGLNPAGVPRALQATAIPFRYNHLSELEAIAKEHGSRIAAIVTEPIRSDAPHGGFLEGVQRVARELGAVLVVDEVTMGFRLSRGGAHMRLGIEPDIAVFAKGMSNGFPMAAIVGKQKPMQALQDTFVSSTYWTERVGVVAALTTIRKLLRENVATRISEMGRYVKEGWKRAAASSGLKIEIGGVDPLPAFKVICEQPLAAKTFFTQEMLRRGFLAGPAVYLTLAHTRELTDLYLENAESTFALLSEALAQDNLPALLNGPVAHSGFTRLT